jgi:hypothetical protein
MASEAEAPSGREAPEKDVDVVKCCTGATLRGRYLFAYDGVVIEGEYEGPFATAGYQVHDGKNEVHGRYSANFNGKIFRNEEFDGTYTVKANCTGTADFSDGSRYDLFIAPDGSMFTFVQTVGSEYVTSGTAHRVWH